MDPVDPNKRKQTAYVNCSVYGCQSRANRNPHLNFHAFPRINDRKVTIINDRGVPEMMDRRKAWMLRVRTVKKVTPNMKICSLHFERDEYLLPNVPRRIKHLKKNAVPSLNLPSRPSQPATQNATQGNSSHSGQLHIKEEPLQADPSDYRLYQQLRDSIKTEPVNSETVPNNGDPEKHIHSISTEKEHFVNVKKEYSDSCENEINVNHETEQIPMFESVFVKEEPFDEDFPL